MSDAIDLDAALEACAREPIHVPGSIQPHGALLAVREPDLVIARASRSAEAHFGARADDLIDAPLSTLLDERGLDAVRSALRREHPEDACLSLEIRAARFDGTLHRHAGATILELEPGTEGARAPGDAERRLVGVADRLEDASDLDELCAIAVREIRALTGFGRVMFYEFEADDHGWVRAEDRGPDEASYLGLHFPASDIPAQARALYVRNPIRVIPDRAYAPSPIVPVTPPLDLSGAVLRSVSPVHLEYLANMGVRASMSISIVRDGRLVALVACHDRSVRHVPHSARAGARLVARLVELHFLTARARARAARRETTTGALRGLRARFDEEGSERALAGAGESLLALVEATGAALVTDGRVVTVGDAPDAADVARLVETLARDPETEVHAHDALPSSLEASPELRARASGVLAVAIPKPRPDWLLWFRPEVVRTVEWAGDPHKAMEGTRDRPQPRRSFELWKQTVEGTARAWTPFDREVASALRHMLVEVDLAEQIARERAARAAAEAAEAEAAKAVRAREDLVAVVSHDLKNPVAAIELEAARLRRRLAAAKPLDPAPSTLEEGLQRIQRSTRRMSGLITDLLDVARIEAGRFSVQTAPHEARALVDESIETLRPIAAARGIDLSTELDGVDAHVRADRERVFQVLSNLVGNALKFTPKGGRVVLAARPAGDEVRFEVRDTGPGIPEEARERIFERYAQAAPGERGRVGLGLFIVRGLVEAHGGHVGVESVVGRGSTFWFTLPVA